MPNSSSLGRLAPAVEPLDDAAVDRIRASMRHERPRRRRRRLLAAPVLMAVAIPVLFVALTRGGGNDPAFAAEAIRVAESSPRLLVDGDGWKVTRADQWQPGQGEMTFANGSAQLELFWAPEKEYAGWLQSSTDKFEAVGNGPGGRSRREALPRRDRHLPGAVDGRRRGRAGGQPDGGGPRSLQAARQPARPRQRQRVADGHAGRRHPARGPARHRRRRDAEGPAAAARPRRRGAARERRRPRPLPARCTGVGRRRLRLDRPVPRRPEVGRHGGRRRGDRGDGRRHAPGRSCSRCSRTARTRRCCGCTPTRSAASRSRRARSTRATSTRWAAPRAEGHRRSRSSPPARRARRRAAS